MHLLCAALAGAAPKTPAGSSCFVLTDMHARFLWRQDRLVSQTCILHSSKGVLNRRFLLLASFSEFLGYFLGLAHH